MSSFRVPLYILVFIACVQSAFSEEPLKGHLYPIGQLRPLGNLTDGKFIGGEAPREGQWTIDEIAPNRTHPIVVQSIQSVPSVPEIPEVDEGEAIKEVSKHVATHVVLETIKENETGFVKFIFEAFAILGGVIVAVWAFCKQNVCGCHDVEPALTEVVDGSATSGGDEAVVIEPLPTVDELQGLTK